MLTDGLANVGLTDPETIASQAADVREVAGISTSTFGIGADYDESLLEPLAVAGGGQFHHLRSAREIAATFAGELGELFSVAAGGVQLEMALPAGVTAEVISDYWSAPMPTGALITVGDLPANEERHVVVRFGFPAAHDLEGQSLQARLVWSCNGEKVWGRWSPLHFRYASQEACDEEQRSPAVMHWVGLHHAERAKRRAAELNLAGDHAGARSLPRKVASHIAHYAGNDAELLEAMYELETLGEEMAAPLSAMAAKEIRFQSHRKARGQKDLRQP